jgi:hypothetical protein
MCCVVVNVCPYKGKALTLLNRLAWIEINVRDFIIA